jgi:hypothetical protein
MVSMVSMLIQESTETADGVSLITVSRESKQVLVPFHPNGQSKREFLFTTGMMEYSQLWRQTISVDRYYFFTKSRLLRSLEGTKQKPVSSTISYSKVSLRHCFFILQYYLVKGVV